MMPTLDLIDLFCGAGGMSLGFKQAGFNPVFAIDYDKYSIDTYRANFGNHATCSDIRDIVSFPKADVIIGGPPCQGFSRLGKQAGKQRAENMLWREYMRCVATSKPSVFVIENVEDFFKDAAFEGVKMEASNLGYSLVYGILNAADYGVAQKRFRAFMIGSRIGKPSLPTPTHRPPGESLFSDLPTWLNLEDVIGDLPLTPTNTDLHNTRNAGPLALERYKHIPPGGNRKNLPPHLQLKCWVNKNPKSGGSTDLMGRLRWDAPALTIRTQFLKPEKGCYLHPEAHRSITVREGARLQSFPDDFKFVGSVFQIVKQIGNAVPVELARQIALTLRHHMEEYSEQVLKLKESRLVVG